MADDLLRRAEFSAAMERSARFVAVLLLRHGGRVADEFSENRDRRFAGTVDPINTYAVVGVGVFRDLEHIGRSRPPEPPGGRPAPSRLPPLRPGCPVI